MPLNIYKLAFVEIPRILVGLLVALLQDLTGCFSFIYQAI